MKKYLSLLCATMLCVCCLALAACGGSSSGSSAAASGSAAASASAAASENVKVDPLEKFYGDWKLGALEAQGLTMAGDLSAMLEEEATMSLSIAKDGTGSMTYGGEAAAFTYVPKDDNTITITVTSESEGTDEQSVDIVSNDDGTLGMTMSDEEMTGTMLFSKDGKIDGVKVISLADATPITSKDQLIGTWQFTGLEMMGITMYGDAATLSEFAGGTETSMTFKDDGTVDMDGESISYTVDADGAKIEQGGVAMSILAYGDDIIVDLSSVLDMELFMLLSK